MITLLKFGHMRVALVHDYLIQDGGAERVLMALHEMYPEAPVYTLLHDKKRANPIFVNWDIRTSFLQSVPGGMKRYQWMLPFMPTATESYNLSEYDIVISSSSAFAKGIITRPETLHISYCHTPTRYLWTDSLSYVEELRAPRVVKLILPTVLSYLRLWDRLSADRVGLFIANSETVADRIRKYYNRDAITIHPPVYTESFYVSPKIGNYYLTGGRLVSYKRFDIAVKAFSQLGIPLKVFGEGPELAGLRALAKPNVEFLGKVSLEELSSLYANCVAFLHPQIEDFGITSIEAMSSGRPVIAFGKGGALETISPGLSGTFFSEQTWENLAHTIIRFKPETFDPLSVRKHALAFGREIFKRKMKELVEKEWATFCLKRGMPTEGQMGLPRYS